MKLQFLWITSIIIIIASISCNSENKIKVSKYNSLAIQLNNKAIEIQINNRCNKDSILKSLNLLDSALKIDSSYYLALVHEAVTLCSIRQCEKAINLLSSHSFLEKEHLQLTTLKAFILEESGKQNEALEQYKKSLSNYDSCLRKDTNNISLKLDEAFLLVCVNKPDLARSKYMVLKNRYPKSMEVDVYSNYLDTSFDKHAFVISMFDNCN